MNRAQCERAIALIAILDRCDENIAVAEKATTIQVSLSYKDGDINNGLVVTLGAGKDSSESDRRVHAAVLSVLRDLRASAARELRDLGVCEAA